MIAKLSRQARKDLLEIQRLSADDIYQIVDTICDGLDDSATTVPLRRILYCASEQITISLSYDHGQAVVDRLISYSS